MVQMPIRQNSPGGAQGSAASLSLFASPCRGSMCLLGQNHATGATDGAPIVNSLPHASSCCSAVGFVDSGYRTDNPHSWKTPWSSLVCSGLTGFVPSRELCLHVACSACRADSAASEMTLCWVAVRNWGVPGTDPYIPNFSV